MLQYITHPSERYSELEQARMVIDGGCRWIQLRMKDATDEEVRKTALELTPLCRETDTFLIIDDRVELVDELRVSGVHLGKNDMSPREAREKLGPHAIIGCTANTAADILALRGIDVDYVGLGPVKPTQTKKNLSPILGTAGVAAVMSEVRAAGMTIPVVAIGGVTAEDVPALMAAGVNGVAMSGAILRAENPEFYTAKVIETLENSLK